MDLDGTWWVAAWLWRRRFDSLKFSISNSFLESTLPSLTFTFLYVSILVSCTWSTMHNPAIEQRKSTSFSPSAFCVYSTGNHGECKHGDKTAGRELQLASTPPTNINIDINSQWQIIHHFTPPPPGQAHPGGGPRPPPSPSSAGRSGR